MKKFGYFFWREGKRKSTLYISYRLEGEKQRERFAYCYSPSACERKKLESQANNRLQEIEKEITSGSLTFYEQMLPTYRQMGEFFWDTYWSTKNYIQESKGCWASDRAKLEFSLDYFNDIQCNEIDTALVKEFRTILRKTPKKRNENEFLGNAYINRIVSMIGQVYHWAFEQEVFIYKTASNAEKEKYGNINLVLKLGVKNPILGLPSLKENPQEPMIITHEQFRRLYIELPSDYRYIAIIAAHTGLRKSNILKLVWDQIDLQKGYIKIDNHKGSRGNPRKNPLILKLHQDLMEIFSFLEYRPGELVFPGGFYYRTWIRACKRAGVEGLRLKDLRTNYTSWLVEEGAGLSLLQCALGHKTPLVTGRFYNKAKNATEKLIPLQRSLLNSAE